jgi:hypothetical protein
MPSDPRSHARAAVLATTLEFEPKPIDPFALRKPAVRRVVSSARGPLDLDAAIYRYRADGTVIDEPAGARFCFDRARRHRRR